MTPYRAAMVAALLLFLPLFALTADAATVRGTITDSAGTLLQGRVVQAWNRDGLLVGTASSDLAGSYTLVLPAADYRLLAYDPQGTFATVFFGGADSFDSSPFVTIGEGAPLQVNFTLPAGARFIGTVKGAGVPLPNAVVEVYNLSGTRRGFTTTNAGGAFTLIVPAGDYKLVAWDADGVFAGTFFQTARSFSDASILRATPGAPRTVDFALGPAAYASGGVFDAVTRKGIPGMTVYVYTPEGDFVSRTTTDDQGLFRLALQPGDYRFAAGDPGGTYGPSFWSDKRSFSLADTITLEAGVERPGIVLLAEVGATIAGNVSQPGSIVIAWNLDGTEHARAATDSSGRYSLVVAPGQYKLGAVSSIAYAVQFYERANDFSSARAITMLSGQRLSAIDFDPPRAGRFEGVVRAAVTEEVLPGMIVVAYDVAGARAGEAPTGIDGRYRLPLAPGQYRLLVFDPQLEFATAYGGGGASFEAADWIVVAVDSVIPLDFAMSRGTRVSGTVTTAQGQSAAAEVVALDLAGNLVAATRTANGAFTLVVRPGLYRFEARTPFTVTSTGTVAVGTQPGAPIMLVLEGSARRRTSRH